MGGFHHVHENDKVTIKDEGVTLEENPNSIDFTGAGVTSSKVGKDVTESIPFGGNIGDPVAGGTANSVLFIGAGDVIAEDNPGFTYIPGTGLALDDNLVVVGAITGGSVTTTGTGTFGQIIDNGLTASLGVYTTGGKQLTSTPPTIGILGYWNRTNSNLSPANSGDDVTVTGTGTFNLLQVSSNVISSLIPNQPFNYNLGATNSEWDMLYVGSVIATSTGRFDSGLVDNLDTISIHLTNRTLLADDGLDVILDYSTIGTADFSNSIITTTGDIKIVSDSSLIKFGLAGDGTIGFDGNSLNIIANAVTATDTLDLTAKEINFNGVRFYHNFGDASPANTFIGGAGNFTNSGAISNVGIGIDALRDLTSGDENLGIGSRAIRGISTGFGNVGIGIGALQTLHAGGSNVALGRAALSSIDGGDSNIGIGRNVGVTLANVNENVLIGNFIIDGVASSANNVLLGYGIGLAATSSGNDNTILGHKAVLSTVAMGARNVFIGKACATDETGSDVLMIDNRDRTSEALGRTGAIIYGIMNATPANQTLTFNADVFNNGILTVPKASDKGIKVDLATPTFGFADIIGDQFSKNTGATKPVLTVYNGVVNAWQFGVGDEAYISYHIPHDYVKGTPIFLHIHWSHTGTLVTGGTVTFKATSIYAKAHNQVPFQSSPSVGTFNGAASATQYQQILTEVLYSDGTPTGLEIDTDDLEPDGVIELTFEVDANNITVSGGGVPDIFVHFVDIHYQTTGVIGTKDKAPDFYV